MRRPPRITRIITRLNIGGPARRVLHVTRSLKQGGYDSVLLAGTGDDSEGLLSEDGIEVVPVPHLRQPISPVADVRATREIVAHMRRRTPDILHTHTAKAGVLGRLAAKRIERPVTVHTFHGHVLDGYFSAPVTKIFTSIERRLARRTDALIAVSRSVRDDLLALGIGREDQWHVVRVGLELAPLLRSTRSKQVARASLGLPDDGPIIGSIGRLVPIKDHLTLFDAMARVLRERPDARLVVAGDGELRGELEARARESLGDRVSFLGWVSDLEALYSAVDVVALTSRNEGTPTALIEASATSRPVVATSAGGVDDIVVDGKTGSLVPIGDPAGIAAALLAVLGDPAMARAYGEAGRELVADRFTADRLVRDLDALYLELLDRRASVRAS